MADGDAEVWREMVALRSEMSDLVAKLEKIDRRTEALVIERENADGTVEVKARRSRVSVGTMVAILGALSPFYAATLAVVFR